MARRIGHLVTTPTEFAECGPPNNSLPATRPAVLEQACSTSSGRRVLRGELGRHADKVGSCQPRFQCKNGETPEPPGGSRANPAWTGPLLGRFLTGRCAVAVAEFESVGRRQGVQPPIETLTPWKVSRARLRSFPVRIATIRRSLSPLTPPPNVPRLGSRIGGRVRSSHVGALPGTDSSAAVWSVVLRWSPSGAWPIDTERTSPGSIGSRSNSPSPTCDGITLREATCLLGRPPRALRSPCFVHCCSQLVVHLLNEEAQFPRRPQIPHHPV